MAMAFNTAFAFSMIGQYIPYCIIKIIMPGTVKKIQDLIKPAREYIRENIHEHRASFDPNDIRDFMDLYMAGRDGDPEFTEHRFIDSMLSFMPDAVDTLGEAMLWVIKYLAAYPDQQVRKITNTLNQQIKDLKFKIYL